MCQASQGLVFFEKEQFTVADLAVMDHSRRPPQVGSSVSSFVKTFVLPQLTHTRRVEPPIFEKRGIGPGIV